MSATKPYDRSKARVVFLIGTKAHEVHECRGMSWAYCKYWIAQNKGNPEYQGGVLKPVSIYTKLDQVKPVK